MPEQRKLTKQQLAILTLIYRFRFVSSRQVQFRLGNKQLRQTQRRLDVLVSKDYIGRNYSNADKLNGKYASYYLTSLGVKTLKQYKANELSDKILHATYKDKNASMRFINHSLKVGEIYRGLKIKHGENIQIFTRSDLVVYDYFPNPLPDSFIKLNNEQFFLDYYETSVPFFVHARKIDNYIKYDEQGEWTITNTKLPTISVVCDKELEKRLKKYTLKALNDSIVSSAEFRVSVLSDLSLDKKV